jgi:hypothetical protein
MEVVGLHLGLGGERGLEHNVNVLPVRTALLISILAHWGSMQEVDLGKSLMWVDLF